MHRCINCEKFFENDYRTTKTIKNSGHASPQFCSRTCARQHNGKIIKYISGFCKNCGIKIKIRKGTKKEFCERCLNSHYVRSYKSNNIDYNNVEYKTIDIRIIEKKEYEARKNKSAESRIKNILESDFNDLSWDIKRERILKEQENKCNSCGLSEWMGKHLTLEIDHKDGDNKNDNRDNLEAVCPNCHSITPTWRGRNARKENFKSKIKDEDLVNAFFITGNIRQTLLSVGLAAKGGNYGRVKRLLTQRGINY